MAVLTGAQLEQVRLSLEAKVTPSCDKPKLNAAIQAVEDWFETNRSSLAGVIDTATSPVTLSAAQKKALVAHWLLAKSGREGA